MFHHMLVLGPTFFTQETKAAFLLCARRITYDSTVPRTQKALVEKIGDADALLVALQVHVGKKAIAACPALRYIGMCCSLYGPESANVDILAAQAQGITVDGIRDYGDEGVVEYIISELIGLFHGFHGPQWKDQPMELTGARVGIVGMGTVGTLVSRAFLFFNARVQYYSRTRKPDIERKNIPYADLHSLLQACDVIVCCLNKNVRLLHHEQFTILGNGKIIINIAIGACADTAALREWLSCQSNYYLCDTLSALGDRSLLAFPNVICAQRNAGASAQSIQRYNRKILENVRRYIALYP
jgi:phosphoglycerate dehydrogenase-like enzyme